MFDQRSAFHPLMPLALGPSAESSVHNWVEAVDNHSVLEEDIASVVAFQMLACSDRGLHCSSYLLGRG